MTILSFTARRSVTAFLLCSIALPVFAETAKKDATTVDLDTIYVEGAAMQTDGTTVTLDKEALATAPALDGGALMSTIPGIEGSRMGGHGIDIILRGMSKNQINIIDAGSFTYGGCPSRMDPPTSIASFYRADRIVVEKGYSSVTNGPGAPAGTVRLERDAPEFEAGKKVSGSLTVGGSSNSEAKEISGTLAFDLGHGFYLETSGEYKTANDYKDGSGRDVRAGYTQKSTGVTLGYKNNGVDLALDVEHDRAEDVEFAGAAMDSPLSKTETIRLRGGVDLSYGPLTRIEGSVYRSDVDHRMDNYSLRSPTNMAMLSPTTSDTHGGKLEGKLDFGRTKATVGIDYQSNSRTALGYMAMSSAMIDLDSPYSLTWPDVTIAQTGLYVQTETMLSASDTLRAGLRYDHVHADVGKADQSVNGYSPNDYYTEVYGTSYDHARSEDNVGGLLRYEHQFDAQTKAFIGLSRAVRTADANERAMARGSMGVASYVGNPDIAPEKHNQLDIGFQTTRENWSLNASAFYDRVDDYILQEIVTTSTGSSRTQYRNVGADLSGVEVLGSYSYGAWLFAGDATWTHGENTSDDTALAQIPPLSGSLSATWSADLWSAGARVNWASRQNRIDPSIDPGKTAGWATLDLFGSYQLRDNVRLMGGVDNLLDKTYARHLNRKSVFDTTVPRVNEPGRTAYLSVQMTF
ncbi:TonB-dependent receptor domain-containing protein [Thioclava sp. GXIMD4215]|uniref:TonB-dependent receptor domain-containing protein n=1 Tax=Thioclava sp. GXIMD4215 TaxID=3131928 RepID=UPI00311B31A5